MRPPAIHGAAADHGRPRPAPAAVRLREWRRLSPARAPPSPPPRWLPALCPPCGQRVRFMPSHGYVFLSLDRGRFQGLKPNKLPHVITPAWPVLTGQVAPASPFLLQSPSTPALTPSPGDPVASLVRGSPFQAPAAAQGRTGRFGWRRDRLTPFSIFLFSDFVVVCFGGRLEPAPYGSHSSRDLLRKLAIFLVCLSPALICHFRGSVNHRLLPSSKEWLLCF